MDSVKACPHGRNTNRAFQLEGEIDNCSDAKLRMAIRSSPQNIQNQEFPHSHNSSSFVVSPKRTGCWLLEQGGKTAKYPYIILYLN